MSTRAVNVVTLVGACSMVAALSCGSGGDERNGDAGSGDAGTVDSSARSPCPGFEYGNPCPSPTWTCPPLKETGGGDAVAMCSGGVIIETRNGPCVDAGPTPDGG